jgi:hypothetical protein
MPTTHAVDERLRMQPPSVGCTWTVDMAIVVLRVVKRRTRGDVG